MQKTKLNPNVFETRGNSIYCTVPLLLKIEKSNYEITPEGNLDTFLFGALLVTYEKDHIETRTIKLGTKVIIPIYSNDQIIDDGGDHIGVTFNEGDMFVLNRHVPGTINNVNSMFKALTSGHLSNLIPYHKYYDIIMNNMKTNEVMSFPKILLEAMLGEMFINEKGVKLRRTDADYGISASIDDIIQTAGTFNSMIHEDPNKSILINKGKTREQQLQESKLEVYFRK